MEFAVRNDNERKAVIEYIKALDVQKREYEVVISKKTSKRTLAQNRLYRLWLNCISAETGNDTEMLAEYFKNKFLYIRHRIIYGEHISVVPSTTTLTTEEFKDYLDKIQQWASSEQGIILPNPEDLYFNQFAEKYKNYIG